MSFDFKLAHACPHLTVEEEVVLAADRVSLRTAQPVASANNIRITANDEIVVEKDGTFAPAQLFGSQSGPFNVVQNENTITIANRAQEVTDVVLPSGTRVPTDRIIEILEAAFRNNAVQITATNSNGALALTDLLDRGPVSRVTVSGSAASSLGIINQTMARGRQVYPAWDFGAQENISVLRGLTGIQQITTRFPQFKSQVKNNPVFKVTYTTYQEYCLRCQTFAVENDYEIQATGEPREIRNEDLLQQGSLKILETVKGSNPFHPEYGTMLLTRIGIKAIGAGVTTINEDVNTALRIFQNTQEIQGKYQEVTSRERLATVLSVTTTPSEFDPTVFEVEVIASNASNAPVTLTTVFAAPQVAALAGSNGLSLGLGPRGLDPRTRSIPGVAPR